MTMKVTEGCELIKEELIRNDVRLVASLPDDWMAPLIRTIAQDHRFIHVPVAREPEIVGVCTGAFFGGHNAVGIMGMAGFLTARLHDGNLLAQKLA